MYKIYSDIVPQDGQLVKIPSHPMARFWACPVVPLSRDNDETSVPLSRKAALSRSVGNTIYEPGKTTLIILVEKTLTLTALWKWTNTNPDQITKPNRSG